VYLVSATSAPEIQAQLVTPDGLLRRDPAVLRDCGDPGPHPFARIGMVTENRAPTSRMAFWTAGL
jgi:hypothetical protein